MSIGLAVQLIAYLAIAVPVSISDIRARRIPNWLVVAGLLIALLCALVLHRGFLDLIAGAVIGFGIFAAVRFFSRGRLGLGDVKYSAFLGAICGVEGWFVAIFVASICGLLVAAVLLAADRRFAHFKIPFAPFLSIGGLVAILAVDFGLDRLFQGDAI